MKKQVIFSLIVMLCLFLCSCDKATTSESETSYSLPEINYSEYSLDYLVIRNIDENGRTLSLDYYYDDFDLISSQINIIKDELSNIDYYDGIGPSTGKYNDGWVILKDSEGASFILNFYIYDGYTVLGLMLDELSTEFLFKDIFDDEIENIFEYYN